MYHSVDWDRGFPAGLLTTLQAVATSLLPATHGASSMSNFADTQAAYTPLLAPIFGAMTRYQAMTLVSLYPSQQIVQHCDPAIIGVRYHLPLQTNDGCWCLHDGAWQQLKIGRIYEMDPARPHGAVNWGETTRVHLMVDVA